MFWKAQFQFLHIYFLYFSGYQSFFNRIWNTYSPWCSLWVTLLSDLLFDTFKCFIFKISVIPEGSLSWPREVVYWVTAFVTMHEEMKLIPWTHIVKGYNSFLSCILNFSHGVHSWVYSHVHTEIDIKKISVTFYGSNYLRLELFWSINCIKLF